MKKRKDRMQTMLPDALTLKSESTQYPKIVTFAHQGT